MCGIGFVINYEESKLNLDVVENIFKNMEGRGSDASGIYYERPTNKGEVDCNIFKAPVPATDLWNCVVGSRREYKIPDTFRNKWKLDGTERLIMMHTRYATQGPVSNNANNMPIHGKKWVLIHNGMITGTRIGGYQYKGSVDSEELLARIEMTGDIAGSIASVSGSMAVCIHEIGGDCIYAYRNTNPLSLIIPTGWNTLFGCSLSDYVLDDEMLELWGEESPFKKGHDLFELCPGTIYQIGIHDPEIRQIAQIYDPKKESLKTAMALYSDGEKDDEWKLSPCG